MSTEDQVAKHYTRGSLTETIVGAVATMGKDPNNLSFEDLAPVDEFHVGGLEATQDLAAQMKLSPELRLLDVGCGIGGPARYFAAARRCNVSGIDLTPEFVEAAMNLTRLVKLESLADFQKASALDLPFNAGTFDRAYMIHVGMNIADKAGVFREVRRVLKSGGLFAIFDLMRTRDAPLRFPVPWASTEATSFVAAQHEYREALTVAGFRVTHDRNRTAFAVDFTERAIARVSQSGPPTLGLHLLMGEKARTMMMNVLGLMKEGVIAPSELIAEVA